MHHLYFEASTGIYFAEDAEMTEITTAIPRRMSVRLQDGIILKKRRQLPDVHNNWDTDTFTDDGQGLAGTKVFTFIHVKGKRQHSARRYQYLLNGIPFSLCITVNACQNISNKIAEVNIFNRNRRRLDAFVHGFHLGFLV